MKLSSRRFIMSFSITLMVLIFLAAVTTISGTGNDVTDSVRMPLDVRALSESTDSALKMLAPNLYLGIMIFLAACFGISKM